MRRKIIFSLLTLGITSVISQVIILRELMVVFYGNEFFLGIVLSCWLLFTGIGSIYLYKFIEKLLKNKNFLFLLSLSHFIVSIILPILILLIRFSKTFVSLPGQMPDLLPSLILGILFPFPICIILGLQFPLAAKYLKPYSIAKSTNYSYFLECIGFILGGLIFSFLLILLNPFINVFILSALNCFIAYLLINKPIRIIFIAFFIAFIILSFFASNLNKISSQWKFREKLITVKNSYYGQLAITKKNNQYNFYQNGILIGTLEENPFNELFAHLSLLYHKNPKKILLIGNGFSGLIKEILKHNPSQIYYVELDKDIIKLAKKYLPFSQKKAILDHRVKIINTDGVYFIKNTDQKFDVILVNLPDPSTALLNRFYSQEFFKYIKNKLSENGIFSTFISFSSNYQNKYLTLLSSSVYKTLEENFKNILIVPTESCLIFILSDHKLSYGFDPLIHKLQERNIKTKFINPSYIKYILTNDRIEKIQSILPYQKVKINKNNLPICYAYNFLYWISFFHFKISEFLSIFLNLKLSEIVIIFLAGFFLIYLFRKKIKSNKKILWLSMATAAFSLMTIETLLIFSFQSFYGYIYYYLSILITTFMLGLSIGTYLGTYFSSKNIHKKIKLVALLHLLIISYGIFLFLFFKWNIMEKINWFFGKNILFPLLAIFIGGIIGYEFAIINSIYFASNNSYNKTNSKPHPGFIYSADLIGAFVGAFFTSLFFVPNLGTEYTLFILILINGLVIGSWQLAISS